MNYPKLAQFSQVKTMSLAQNNANRLFSRFRFKQLIKASDISKDKGYAPLEMLFLMLIMVLERSRSMYSGIVSLQKEKLKTPLNNMLNNEHYNWRNLLYLTARRFAELCPVQKDNIPVLIIDDTAKEKSGRKGENVSWFVDHCRKAYFMGFQVIMGVWSNGITAIPIDTELKIGKSRVKHAARSDYQKGTHTEQRERMGKQKKTNIAIQFIKRAMQRRFRFDYLLWDSWYNCSMSLHFVFEKLKPKDIDLISMLKRDKQKYLHQNQYLTSKEIYHKTGKWRLHKETGIKYKSAVTTVLDKKSHLNPENQIPLGDIRMCFYKYPKHKDFKIIISTDTELSELEILELYLRRWAVEVVFRDLKQHFGFDQSKSSKYAPQIADLTIRCVFYIMFCSLRDSHPEKSTEQLLFEFYQEMQEDCLNIFSMLIFQNRAKEFLCFALKNGYTEIAQLLKDYELMLMKFFNEEWYENKIVDMDKRNFMHSHYRKVK